MVKHTQNAKHNNKKKIGMRLFRAVRYVLLLILAVYLTGYVVLYQGYKTSQSRYTEGLNKTADYAYQYSDVDIMATGCLNSTIIKFPKQLQDAIRERWDFIICSDFISSEHSNQVSGSIFGQTDENSKTIRLRYSRQTSDQTFEYICAHEIGHIISGEYGSAAYSAAFEKIYQEHNTYMMLGPTIQKDYAVCNEAEFFATVMAETVLYPEQMQKENPNCFQYAVNLLNTKLPDTFFAQAQTGVTWLVRNSKKHISDLINT